MIRLEFTRKTKAKRFLHCGGKCELYGVRLMPGKIEFHHDKPAADGGDNSFENARAVCKPCHSPLTKVYTQALRKSERIRDRNIGALKSSRPFPKRQKPERTITKPPLKRPQLYVERT